jgi:flagellar basal-body rod protein FlgB
LFFFPIPGGNIDSIPQGHLADILGMSAVNERHQLLSHLLDVALLRQEVIAQNVANVNTPGYRTLDVNFDQMLDEQITSQGKGHADPVQPEITEGTGGIERPDGNNVDIDLEMARLQKNTIYFKTYLQILATHVSQQRSAIAGR